jgi:prepilin peptidase CpaA
MWATTLYDHPSPPLQWGAVLGSSLVAAFFDARSRRIPNLLTGPLWLAGLVCAVWIGGVSGLIDAAVASVVLALPFILLFVFAGGGAGDAKMMGALGAWLGIIYGTGVLVAVCLCGVILAVVWSASKQQLSSVLATVSGAAKGMLHPLFGVGSYRDLPGLMPSPEQGLKMPYGLAILAGTFVAGGGFFLWKL